MRQTLRPSPEEAFHCFPEENNDLVLGGADSHPAPVSAEAQTLKKPREPPQNTGVLFSNSQSGDPSYPCYASPRRSKTGLETKGVLKDFCAHLGSQPMIEVGGRPAGAAGCASLQMSLTFPVFF